ncbi:MAG TPA: ECF-type sigma factor [Gemmataceae bacterium]|jgi:RNA polymerase sigma factor (TIGR02999 family)
MSDVTVLLDAIQSGDPGAPAQLLPLVYDELRRLAAHRLGREAPGQTLQPTALVHEAYLRLVHLAPGDSPGAKFANRAHFFAAAAEAMRRILVETARRKRTLKRGGALGRRELDAAELLAPEPREDLIALDEALTALAAKDPAAAELVQLRYFGGVSVADAAQVLGISLRSAERLWTYTRAWLLERVTTAGRGDGPP